MKERYKEKTPACPSPDAGFSLAEIIVAILILAIAIVPLLTNLIVSAQVNAKAYSTKNVTDFAEQIMETLQSYTPDQVDEQFAGEGSFTLVDTDAGADYGRTDESFDTGSDIDAVAGDGQARYYYICGAFGPDGKSYDVQICYDPAGYSSAGTADGTVHAYNLEEFPDSGVFARESTAIINPSDIHVTFPTGNDGKNIFDEDTQSYEYTSTTSFEETAVDGFYGIYMAFIGEVRTEFENLLLERDISSKFTLSNSDFMDSQSEAQKKAKLRSSMQRYTIIDITDGDGKINLAAYLQFQLTDAGYMEIIDQTTVKQLARVRLSNLKNNSNNPITVTDDEINDIVSEAAEAVLTEKSMDMVPCYKVFYSSDGYDDLQNVYLMMKPLSAAQFAADSDSIIVRMSSEVKKHYGTGKALSLYMVPQIGLLENKSQDAYVKPKLTGMTNEAVTGGVGSEIKASVSALPTENMSVYYADGWLSQAGSFSLIKAVSRNSLVKKDKEQFIYDIKVSIYEGNGGKWTKLLTQLDSSGY